MGMNQIEIDKLVTKKKNFHLYLDAGHGGIDPSGKYTTLNAKMFEHTKGNFHNGRWFYEGVSNRVTVQAICELLDLYDIKYTRVYHEYLDTSLEQRVRMANEHASCNKGRNYYYSFHSNATGNHTARGFTIWTAEGKSESDINAQDFMDRYKARFIANNKYGVKVLEDKKDGDSDYESNFYVLRNTSMPAVLFENLFFDEYNDACVLMNQNYINEYAEVFVEHILWLIKNSK